MTPFDVYHHEEGVVRVRVCIRNNVYLRVAGERTSRKHHIFDGALLQN